MKNNERILNAVISNFREENNLKNDLSVFDYFTVFQILKDKEIDTDDINTTIVDGGQDGGIDSVAVFINDKKRLRNYLNSEGVMRDLNELSRNKPDLFSWDCIMIDEAQDWPDDERDLIYRLFGPNKIIIADGVGQLVRNTSACDWASSPYVKEKQIVNFKTSLRQKPNLTRFIKEITEKLGLLYDWDVIDNDEYNGGKGVIFEGGYSKKFHDRLIKQNKDDKNENIDMLFCVPPENVNINHSILGDTLDEWGYSVWDGVDDKIRESRPTSLNQFRIVQYDSSRGLEG